MIAEVNQENLYLLLPSKVSHMTEYLVEEKGMTIIDAIKRIYSSVTYSNLASEVTKKWHLGPVDLYQELLEE